MTITVTADRAALVALYNATGGADWTNNTNWLSNEALSEWHRVETDEDGRVTALRLVANELSGKIPAELGNLTNLEDLFLNRNELSGPLPLTLSALSQLLVLDIRETTLCAPVNTAFQAWLATIDFQGTVCAPPRPPGPVGPRTSAPDAPRNLLADATDGAVTLMWEAPEDDGGTVITDYEYRIDQRGDWISIGSTATTHTVTGLVNGTTYVFQVRAVNRVGRSGPSLPAEATPIAQVVLDLAHFANGAGIISEVVLVNVAPPSDPARSLLLRSRRRADRSGIDGGCPGRSGDPRGRSPEHPVGDGAAGRTHDLHLWPGRVSEWIGAGGLGWSHRRGPAL